MSGVPSEAPRTPSSDRQPRSRNTSDDAVDESGYPDGSNGHQEDGGIPSHGVTITVEDADAGGDEDEDEDDGPSEDGKSETEGSQADSSEESDAQLEHTQPPQVDS